MVAKRKSRTKSKGKTVSKASARKKQKSIVKKTRLPLSQFKKHKGKIDRKDEMYQSIAKKYKTRAEARTRAGRIGITNHRQIEGNDKNTAQRNLIDAIYIETSKVIDVTKSGNVREVQVTNTPDGSLVTLNTEVHDDQYVILDQNSTMIRTVDAQEIMGGREAGLIQVGGKTLEGETFGTLIQINPTEKKKLEIIAKHNLPPIKSPDNIYSEIKGNRLSPVWNKPAGVSRIKETRKLLAEYEKKDLIPFYYPNNMKKLVDLDDFKNVPIVDYLTEKDALLPKDRGKYTVTTGQHIQTQVFDIPKGSGNFEWVGLYFQPRSNADKDNPIPTIVKAKQIRADNDDAGHFIAYINNMYAFNDPLKKNFKVEGKSTPIRPEEFRAMRFMSKSIINTLGVKRNFAIKDAITKNLGARALKYRTDKGLRPLIISEQIVEITKLAQKQKIVARVKVADRAPIDFEVDFEKWNEAPPSVKFIETGKIDPSTGKIAVHSLDSDTLLKIIVRKFNIDMVSAQRMLESLHNQDWITYPRADIQKSVDAPIRITNAKKRKALESLIDKQKKSDKPTEPSEQLTLQEFEVLRIVYEAEKASDRKENYVKNGYWELRSGDLFLHKKDNTVLASEPQSYSPKLFDIVIQKKTLDENDMLEFLIDNNIGTPATRSAQIERLRQAGILTFRDGNYVIDRRGYYMVAAHNVMAEEEVPFVKDLLGEIDQVKDKDYDGLNSVVNKFKFIDRSKLAKDTAKEAKKLIEAEHDLTYLDSF